MHVGLSINDFLIVALWIMQNNWKSIFLSKREFECKLPMTLKYSVGRHFLPHLPVKVTRIIRLVDFYKYFSIDFWLSCRILYRNIDLDLACHVAFSDVERAISKPHYRHHNLIKNYRRFRICREKFNFIMNFRIPDSFSEIKQHEANNFCLISKLLMYFKFKQHRLTADLIPTKFY